jgi:hypothetical protein
LTDLDIDYSKLHFDAALLDTAYEQIGGLESEQQGNRLHRMEQSMLRLERSNLEMLALLKKFVAALHRSTEEKQP